MSNDVSSPFPDYDLRDQSIIGVDTGDAAATVVTFTIHLSQDVPPALLEPLQPLLPNEVTG